MKRLISTILLMSLLLSLVPLAVLPTSAAVFSGICGDNLIWTLDTETGFLDITGTGDMTDWENETAVPWYSSPSIVRSVRFDIGITSIGAYALYKCADLTSVVIPDGVTNIGKAAFCACTNLTRITIPDSVTSICKSAFASCDNMMTVTIPDGVTSISDDVFAGCRSLRSISVPDKVTSIGDGAFYNCWSLSKITIPDGVTNIGVVAFDNTAYYNEASNWTGEALYIGNHLIKMKDTFLGDVQIKDGTKTIAGGAFEDCTWLTSVIIPDSITGIGDSAFRGCSKLTSVTIPNGVKSINELTFLGCTELTNVVLPDKVTRIGYGAFMNCTNLASIKIPDSVTTIEDEAFITCSTLTSVIIPNSVTTIGKKAFGYIHNNFRYSVVDGFTIYGYKDSAAQTYAEKNGFAFVDLGDVPVEPCEHGHAHPEHKDATCTEDGYDRMICDDCGAVINEEIISALGDRIPTIPYNAVTFNGHCYYYFSSSTTWETAKAACEELGGHLATITSATEESMIDSLGISDCWLGGYREGDDWKWVTGEPWSYTYWGSGEPNNYLGKEWVLGLYYYKWNDYSPTEYHGYICEWDAAYSHPFGEWKVQTPSTCTESGTEIAICPICKEQLIRETPALGHNIVTDTAVPATCLQNGLTAGEHCIRCDYKVAQVTVPPLGHMWDNGKITTKPTAMKDGVKTFTCTRCGATRSEAIPATGEMENPFNDVKKGDFYYDAVLWAVNAEPKVTAGTSKTTFSPNDTCTRAQVVTFLWRAKGCPEPKTENNPFSDVKAGEYYYKAVLWAVENNITAGTSKTTFSPSVGCTRAQVVTFLWRTEGQPKPTSSANPFKDVTGGYYYDAVLWAVEKGITAGTSKTTFSPDNTCTRGQIVTFLYRAFAT